MARVGDAGSGSVTQLAIHSVTQSVTSGVAPAGRFIGGERPVVVAFLSTPWGRWSNELDGKVNDAVTLRQFLTSRCNQYHGAHLDSVCLVGFGVVAGARLVEDVFATADAHALSCAAVSAHHKRSGARFVEHRILARAAIPVTFNQVCGHLVGLQSDIPPIREAMHRWQPRVVGEHTPFIANVLDEWVTRWRVILDNMLAWPVCPLLAHAFVCGHLDHDVSVVWRREIGHSGNRAPSLVGLSQRCLSRLVKDVLQKPFAIAPDQIGDDGHPVVEDVVVKKQRRGSVTFFTFKYMYYAIRCARHLKAQEKFEAATRDFAVLLDVLRTGKVRRSLKRVVCDSTTTFSKGMLPSKDTLLRGRIRYDIASMLARRGVYSRLGPFYRYIYFDASPQRPGVEIFATSERVVRQTSVIQSKPSGAWPLEVEERRLALASLGQGRASLSDKVHAHCHQCWLEYGPSVESLRVANADVRGVLSDMGVELGICDYADILDSMFPLQQATSVTQAASATQVTPSTSGHLYPFALIVPGPQHIIDTVIRSTLSTLLWWPAWQSDAKVVCQWLNGHSHREVLINVLRAIPRGELPAATLAGMMGSFATGCESFANWRWKTIANVVRDLQRMEAATRKAMSYVRDESILGSQDAATIRRVVLAMRSTSFWARARGLSACVRPLSDLSSWLRGCSCHEVQRMRGKIVKCKWAGCRAFEFAAKLRSVEAQLRLARDAAIPVGMLSTDWTALHVNMLSMFQLKFAWVHKPPYTVWQIVDEETAVEFLAAHDEAEERGDPIHRVTHFIAGRDAWTLRRDLEIFLDTRGHYTDRLWAELQAYRMCPLDETAIEAVHRDVSGEGNAPQLLGFLRDRPLFVWSKTSMSMRVGMVTTNAT